MWTNILALLPVIYLIYRYVRTKLISQVVAQAEVETQVQATEAKIETIERDAQQEKAAELTVNQMEDALNKI